MKLSFAGHIRPSERARLKAALHAAERARLKAVLHAAERARLKAALHAAERARLKAALHAAERARLKTVLHAVLQPIFLAILLAFTGTTVFAQTGGHLSGRWNLTIETAQWQIVHPIDLHVEETGSARLVLLGPVGAGDGLFRGVYDGGRFDLAGRLDGREARFLLTTQGDTLNGSLDGPSHKATVTASRVPGFRPEVRVRDYQKIFEGAWKAVRLEYFDPAIKGIDWEAMRVKYLPIVRAARDDGELAVSVRRMLGELGHPAADFHLSAGAPAYKLKIPRIEGREISAATGYLAIRSFSPDDLYTFDSDLDSAMDVLGGKRNIILDLRGNRGESMEAALAALNILLPTARSIAYFVTRQGLTARKAKSIGEIDPGGLPAAFIDNPAAVAQMNGAGMYLAGGKYKRPYFGRYLVLIDELCGGSCEIFAEAVREAGVAELIGRRTSGRLAVSTSVTFTFVEWFRIVKNDVPGWRMTLPRMDILTAGKKRIDGAGIEPDVKVERKTSGDDPDLEAAMLRIGGN